MIHQEVSPYHEKLGEKQQEKNIKVWPIDHAIFKVIRIKSKTLRKFRRLSLSYNYDITTYLSIIKISEKPNNNIFLN